MDISSAHTLAIDSSTSVLKVGLAFPNGRIMTLESRDRFRHAEAIFDLIERLLRQNSVDKNDLTMIIISKGPGSFTGLRVGMASAKGLAVSLEIPLVGVSTYAAFAGRLFNEFGKTGVLIPSRRNEFYFGLIESDEFDDDNIKVISVDDTPFLPDDIRLFGIDFDILTLGFPHHRLIMGDEFSPDLRDIVLHGQESFSSRGSDDISKLSPLYIKKFPAGKKY
jgi:tRNA threonylcarbamoyl adenosine modification protein YeaZ